MANNDSGSLSYSLNIDTSQISKEIRNVEKQLSTISMIADMSVNTDAEQIIKAIKNALMAEDFKLKVTLDDSFDATAKKAFSVLDSTAKGALDGFLSGGWQGGVAGAALNGVLGLVSAYMDYSEELERLDIETAQTIKGIDQQKQSVNTLLGELIDLTDNTTNSNATTSERIRLLNELSELEPALAESIRQQATNQNVLNEAMQQYNTLAEFKKFSIFLANDNRGLFSDSLLETLDELGKVESKLKIAEFKVQKTYNKAYEIFKGNLSGQYAKDMEGLSDDTLKRIDQIFAAKESEAKKVENLFNLLHRSTQGIGSISFKESAAQIGLRNIIGGSMNDDTLTEFKRASYDFNKEKETAEKAIQEFTDNLKAHMSANGLDIKENEGEIKKYIKTWGELSEYAQKEILSKIGIKWDEPKEELSQWQQELQNILGDSISIGVTTTMPQAIADIRSKYAILKQSMESLEPVLIKAKYNFEKDEFEGNINDPFALNARTQYLANKNVKNGYEQAGEKFNIQFEAPKATPKATGLQKDEILEKYKAQIELIKKLSDVYKQNKEIWDDKTALEKTFESYKSQLEALKLTKEDIADPISLFKGIQSKVANNKNRSKEIDKIVLDDIHKVAQEGQKEEWKKLNDEIEKVKKAYELYESIRAKLGEDKAKEFVKSDTGVDISTDSFGTYFEEVISGNAHMASKMANDLKEKYGAKTKETLTGLLQDFQTTEDKANAIKEKYNERLKQLEYNKDSMDFIRYSSTKEQITNQMASELAPLNKAVLEKTEMYKKLFEDASKLSDKELNNLIQKFRTAIQAAYSEGTKEDGLFHLSIDGEDITKTGDELTAFVEKVDKEEKKLKEKNPFKTLGESFGKLYENSLMIDKLNEDIALLKVQKSKTTDPQEIAKLDEEISKTEKTVQSLKAQNATTWANMATQITNATKKATDLGNSFVSLFSSFAPGDTDTAATMNDIIGIVGGVGEAGAGIARIASGDIIGGLTQGIKGVASVVSSITSLGDRKHEKRIKQLQKAIDESKTAYKELGREAAKSFDNGKFDTQKKQLVELQQQQALIQQQIDSENKKKKTDKDKIKGWEEQKQQLKHDAEDLITSMSEEIRGSVGSMASSIADSLISAFEAGENAQEAMFKAIKDNLKKVIADMFMRTVIVKMLQPMFDEMDKMLGKKEDGTFSKYTFTPEEVKRLVAMGDNISGNIWDTFESGGWKDIFKQLTGGSNQKELSGLSKGVQGMTEDTAMILEAYMNTIRDVVISVMMNNENQLSVLQTSQMIQSQILTEVSAINSNTVALNRAFQSVIAQSGGDNGAGIRVYVK